MRICLSSWELLISSALRILSKDYSSYFYRSVRSELLNFQDFVSPFSISISDSDPDSDADSDSAPDPNDSESFQ
jgi:hypothetical protein